MQTSDFHYDLPSERIAQTPIEPRHNSRLMVLRRGQEGQEDAVFKNIGAYLKKGDLLVINQTRFIPARIFAHKPSGGKVELLLLKGSAPIPGKCSLAVKKLLSRTGLDRSGPQRGIEVLDASHRV